MSRMIICLLENPELWVGPKPGSPEAVKEGCTCPESQYDWPRQMRILDNCPFHKIELEYK